MLGLPSEFVRRSWSLLAVVALVWGCREAVSLGGWGEQDAISVETPRELLPPGGPDESDAPPSESDDESEPSESDVSDPTPTAQPLDASVEATDEPDAEASEPSEPDAGSELLQCLVSASPGSFNRVGPEFGATETSTDWTWPANVEAMEWDFMVEREPPLRSRSEAPLGGYYWMHRFSFTNGVAGIFGLQAEGGYQTDPPNSPIEITKMAVFWVSGPPLDAELGDISYPDARVAPATASGLSWLTIHARFPWQACHIYRMRVGPESEDDAGNLWYGAWINDITDGTETLLGRVLLPPDVGRLSAFSVSRTSPIDFGTPASCAAHSPVSAIFGTPRSLDGSVVASAYSNRFAEPPRCGNSRFAEVPGGVRHELGAVR